MTDARPVAKDGEGGLLSETTNAAQDSDALRTLDEVLAGYTVIGERNGYIVARKLAEHDNDPGPGKALEQKSAGMGGQTLYAGIANQDYNPNFNGPSKYTTYREMRTDAQIRNSLRIAKAPVLGARWFMKPAGTTPLDIEISDHIWRNFMEYMSTSWQQLLVESMLFLDYGEYVFEKVFDFIDTPTGTKVIWRRLVPVHVMDIAEWLYEDDGGPAGVKLSDENETEIEIHKLLIFTLDKEGGNMQGMSLLRSAYKHHFFKENLYKIDAIQKERHSVGVPIIKLPITADVTDIATAHAIGEGLRANERAHIVCPANWTIEFAKLESQPVSALESAKHHGEMIYENVLGHMLDTEQGENMFLKSARFIAEIVRDTWNKYAIPQLVKYNWPTEELTGMPELMVRRLGDTTDWRVISFALRNFAGSGFITPTEDDEEWVREEMDLPIYDESKARELPQSKQVPGSNSPSARVGPSQQTPPPSGTPANSGRGGRDVGGQ